MNLLTHWQISTMTFNDWLNVMFGGPSVETIHFFLRYGVILKPGK